MTTFLTILHVLLCAFLIAVVLLQSGKSGGMGVLSGAASQQVFGGRGAGNFLQRLTTIVAFMFLATCTALGYFASSTQDRGLNSDTATPTADGGAAADASAAADARAVPSNTSLTPPVVIEPAATADAGAAPAVETAPAVNASADAG